MLWKGGYKEEDNTRSSRLPKASKHLIEEKNDPPIQASCLFGDDNDNDLRNLYKFGIISMTFKFAAYILKTCINKGKWNHCCQF